MKKMYVNIYIYMGKKNFLQTDLGNFGSFWSITQKILTFFFETFRVFFVSSKTSKTGEFLNKKLQYFFLATTS